ASLYDEENDVLFTYRTQDVPASWHDNVKFQFLLSDLSRPDVPGRAYGGIKTQYQTGGNNEYLSLVAPIKYNGKYYFFPQNRPFDGQIGYFDPAAVVDSDGSLEGPNLKGQVGVAGDVTMVLTKAECGQINTASPLTTDGQYVVVTGAQTDTFSTSNPPDKNAMVVLVDLEKAENNQEYETFYREYNGKGPGSSDRRAAGKVISDTVGAYSMHIDNGDGTNSVYFFQAGKKVHKAVVNDLDTYDVTVEECAPSGMIPIEYVMYNGGRVTYKGRISGLTVFQNRYILFHALGHGIYSFDTSDETLTKIFDTTNDLVRYGVMRYEKGKGVPEIDGNLYFIPEGATAPDNVTYDLRLLKVYSDLTVDEIPFDVPNFGCDFSIVSGDETIMMFNQGSETLYVYDIFINRLQTVVSDTEIFSGTPYGSKGAAILTPNTSMSAANKWDYPTVNFYVAGNSLSASVVRNTDFTENQLIANHDSDLAAYSSLSLTTTIPDHEERITEHDTSWRELYDFGLEPAGFYISRKHHTSIWDEDENVLFTWRTQDVPYSWHDNVKFSFVVTDMEYAEKTGTRYRKIKTQYQSGGNNEYYPLIASPIKWEGKYFFFPQYRPQEGQIGWGDPAATTNTATGVADSDGEGNLLKGDAGVWGDDTLVLANAECEQINTATPLTTDGQYIIVTGAETETWTSANPPDKNALAVLVDLEKTGNNQEYETFTKEYTGTGPGSDDRRAAGKVISDTIGSYSMHVENGDGTNSVYFFQAGQQVHKAVVNDLDAYDVTVEPLGDDAELLDFLDGLSYAELLTGDTIVDQGGSFSGSAAGIVRVESLTTGGHMSWQPRMHEDGSVAKGYVLRLEHSGGTTYAKVTASPWSNGAADDTHVTTSIIAGDPLVDGSTVTISAYQDASTPLPIEFLPYEIVMSGGARVTYRGRISGLTTYKNRWIIFHSLGHGIYAFDTSDETLNLIFDTSDDLVRYGVMQYEKNKGVPEHDGNLYFIPEGATAPNNITYDLKILRVDDFPASGKTSNMTVTAIPFDVPGFGCDFSIKAGEETIMMFNQGGETFYTYDFFKNKLQTVVSEDGFYTGTVCRGELVLTPNTSMSAPNKWDYPRKEFHFSGNAISEGIVRNTNYLNNRVIA
ncbi:MAG: hypothetical protein VW270_13660, partial [Candidatus Poseidoniales archaeon]